LPVALTRSTTTLIHPLLAIGIASRHAQLIGAVFDAIGLGARQSGADQHILRHIAGAQIKVHRHALPDLKIGRVGIFLSDTRVLKLNGIHRNAPAAQFLLDAISETQRDFCNGCSQSQYRIFVKAFLPNIKRWKK
jgi:hypothetical protein